MTAYFPAIYPAMRQAVFCFALMMPAAAAWADPLTGEGEFGLSITSGNTESSAFAGKAKLEKKHGAWTHRAGLEAIKTSTDGITSAQRYVGTLSTARDLSALIYLFGAARYDADKFSGFSYQTSVSGGVGFHLIKPEPTLLDVEVGPGYRVDRTLDGEVLRDAILRGLLRFERKLTDNSKFLETILVEYGEDNTYAESFTGLNVGLNKALALRLGYTVKHNSNPPLGRQETDSYSTVTLAFKF